MASSMQNRRRDYSLGRLASTSGARMEDGWFTRAAGAKPEYVVWLLRSTVAIRLEAVSGVAVTRCAGWAAEWSCDKQR